MVNEMKLCNVCKETKPASLMRKNGDRPMTRCKVCELKIRNEKKAKIKGFIDAFASTQPKPKKVENAVPPRTFQYKPYVPEKVWTRNNGNVHIPSRGFQC